MRISRFMICLVFFALLLAGWSATAKAVVLDWDTVTWNPGSLSNSYDLNGDSINDITVTLTAQNANVWTNDPVSGDMTPAVNQSITGGVSGNSLILAANLHTNSRVTLQLSFTGVNYGATNVSFTIFDIDVTTNSDIINNIYGVALDGTHVAATITNIGSNITPSGTMLNQVLSGNAASPNNSSNGNATIGFGATIITDVFFTFGNNAGAPFYQDIAIGDVSFTPVPEINPAISASVSCLIAIGLTVFVQRRARMRRNAR
ncbi:MAG: hypothetical protein QOF24_240 [Verrucomicrobiota bacterium]|jgi:hypothetical protein